MTRRKTILLSVMVIALAFGGALALTWAQEVPAVTGITVADEHPNGCIDCHRNAGEGRDYRLNASLKARGHVDISAMVRTLPGDCGTCHKAGTPLGGLNVRTHSVHYENPTENSFVTRYGGDCLACHKLDSATGIVSLKSAPKNW